MRFDYRTEKFQKVSVCGIPCYFSDMHIDRGTVPEGDISTKLQGMMIVAVIRPEYSKGYWSISLER